TFSSLIAAAKNTAFGKEHAFNTINCYDDFKQKVPLRSYDDFKIYIEKIFNREANVLWTGLPSFFAKSSGTSGNPKLLPVTNDFLHSTQMAALYMLCNLSRQLNSTSFMNGKVLTLADQQDLEEINGFLCGAISSIKMYNKPAFTKWFSFPNNKIKNIEGAAEKIKYIIQNVQGRNIKTIVALPVYLSYFLQQFELQTKQKFKDAFPNFNVAFLSGMNYEPYENLLRNHLGEDVLLMENYSATEGNFAYQVQPNIKGMELISNNGIFYEFVELKNIHQQNAERLPLKDVKESTPYSIVISANNGIWAYVMNDIVEFVSTQPYKLIVKGRLNDIFSPFGEHMLPIQAEQAIAETCKQTHQTLIDFCIVPDFNHFPFRYKCYASFEHVIDNVSAFEKLLHQQLSLHNSYYDDLAKTGAITYPEILCVPHNFFISLNASKSGIIQAQQKTNHLVSNKEKIEKLENIFNQYNVKCN
ncbi:MAG TPA: GH3 auxin-responsive promoter family protein, partial [Parafilimonas sp.]|nr:GH3 auxin-responsive promoter family protein [Parafilimonas sp.]